MHFPLILNAEDYVACLQKMAFEASGMTIPGTEIGPVVTAEIPTKVLCLTEVFVSLGKVIELIFKDNGKIL